MLLQTLINGTVAGSIYVLMALGFTLVFGVMRVVNLAHGEFYMLGAFLTYLVARNAGAHPLLAIVVGMGGAAALGVGIEHLVFRPLVGRRALDVLMASIGLLIMIQEVGIKLFGPQFRAPATEFGSTTIRFADVAIAGKRLLILGGSVLLVLVLYLLLQRTYLGKQIRATGQDGPVAELIGVDVRRIHRITFAFACALAGGAGGLLGLAFTIDPTMGLTTTLKAFIISIFGGMGSLGGAVLGGLFLGMAESLSTVYIHSASTEFVSFIVLIIVLLVRPHGVLGRPVR